MNVLNKLLSECIRDVDQIIPLLHLSAPDAERIREISERYPICIPPYYLGLINMEDPMVPIRRICIPRKKAVGSCSRSLRTHGSSDLFVK
jgi:L-lysine 2,3-aminomutase